MPMVHTQEWLVVVAYAPTRVLLLERVAYLLLVASFVVIL